MSLPRIILICGITLCYVTRDGMYRHDSGQQILLVKSMRGGDETDVTKALSSSWCCGQTEPSRPSWRFQAAKVHFFPSKPCKVKWVGRIVGIMSSRKKRKKKRKERNASGSSSQFYRAFKLPLVLLPVTSKVLFKCGSPIRCFHLLSLETKNKKLW